MCVLFYGYNKLYRAKGDGHCMIKNIRQLIKSSPMSKELTAIVCAGGALAAAAFVISLAIEPDISMLWGLFIGWLYMSVCYIYLADTVNSISSMKDVRAAKRKMRICYFMRFSGLFLLCWIGFETNAYNVIGVLVPQFFPKFILYCLYYTQIAKKGKTNGRS